jgi:hypothetical protein
MAADLEMIATHADDANAFSQDRNLRDLGFGLSGG